MTDEATSKGLTINIPGITDVIGSIWAKILTILAAISILLGIALEIQSFVTGYYVLQKTILETKAASFQPALVAAQAFKAEVDASAGGQTFDRKSTVRLGTMFDLLDPNHPHMVSAGISEPDPTPLLPFVKKKPEE